MPEEQGGSDALGSKRVEGVSVVGVPARRSPGSSRNRARGRAGSRGSARARHDEIGDPEEISDEDAEKLAGDEDQGWALKQSGSRRARGRMRRGVLPFGAEVAAIVLAIVGVVAGVGFGFAWSNLNGQNSERQAVANAARSFVLDVTNFRPTTVDADFAQVQNWAAGGSLFAKQAAQFYNSNIRQSLISVQAVSQGQIRNLYVETLGGSKAEVYAVVDQAYQNSKLSSPATDTLRLTLDMTSTSQGWRISAVTVENPSSSGTNPSTPSSTTPGG